MDEGAVAVVISELGSLLRQDGADLRLIRVDEKRACIQLSLELDDANCLDCVLAPDDLFMTVDAALRTRVPEEFELQIQDPRRMTPG